MIVDTHPHIISDDLVKYPVSPIGAVRSQWSIDRHVTVEGLLEEMDNAGVDKAIVVHATTVYGFDNSYVADAIRPHTDRLGGVFTVNGRADVAPYLADFWRSRPGMMGLRLFTAGSTLAGQAYNVDDPATYPLWQMLSESGLPVCLQATAAAYPDVERLLKRFPGVTVILDHFGKPVLDAGTGEGDLRELAALASYDNLFLKYTPHVVAAARRADVRCQEVIAYVVRQFGANRIMWGSNYPNNKGSLSTLLEECVEGLSELSEGDRHQICAGTALKVYAGLG